MSDEDWGPWIEHDGSGSPLPAGVLVAAVSMNSCGAEVYSEGLNPAFSPCWIGGGFDGHGGFYCPVVRYRVRKPRALQQLIELVENLPVPKREEIDA